MAIDREALKMKEQLDSVMSEKPQLSQTKRRRERKRSYNIMLTPSVKELANTSAQKLDISMSAFIEQAILNEINRK